MVSPALQEQNSFIYFLFLLFFTAIVTALPNAPNFFLGLLPVLWGGMGMSRYLHLSGTAYRRLPKILTLPSRILFGFNQQKEKEVHQTIDCFFKFDFVFIIFIGMFFIIWGVYSSFYPADISLIQSFWAEKETLLNKPETHVYIIIERVTAIITLALLFFIAMTYSQNLVSLNKIKIILLPLLLLGMGCIIIFLTPSLTVLNYDFSSFKGIGWGGFSVIQILAPDMIQNIDSAFVRRYIETGLVGAYMPFVIFLPVFFSLSKQLLVEHDRLGVAIALLTLIFLLALDVFWHWTPFIHAFQFLALAFIGCFWRSPLTKEQI